MTIMLHKKNMAGPILHTGAKPKEDKKAPHLYDDSTGLLENENYSRNWCKPGLPKPKTSESCFQLGVSIQRIIVTRSFINEQQV
jgi:hypothetical protein